MSNHTPGPWQVEYDELTEEWLVFWKRGYASVGGFNNTYNAHLIAAAPDLLYALEEILLNETKLYNDMATVIEAKAAVAKAKGETE